MLKPIIAALALCALASLGRAGAVLDWTQKTAGQDFGIYQDGQGSKISVTITAGPQAAQSALGISANVAQWAGAWASFRADMSKAGGLGFKAKSPQAGLMMVALNDARKSRVEARVRLSADWASFSLPLSIFEKTRYPDPQAPKDADFQWNRVESITFAPLGKGEAAIAVGAVTVEDGKLKPVTGFGSDALPKGQTFVQDFTMLDKAAYGTFTDKLGSVINLDLAKGEQGGKAAVISYELKDGGWCGCWIRCGEAWGGQDWRGAKELRLKVYSQEPQSLEIGFNDANQNAYVALVPASQGKGWETLVLPVKNFELNKYYQPEGAKKGAAQDLSHIETFNVSPKNQGKHEVRIESVILVK